MKNNLTVNNRAGVSYICVADVQNHKAELTVLILVQLMNQLSVVSLQQKTHSIQFFMQNNTGDGKAEFCRNSFYVTQIEPAVSQIFQ